MVVARRYARALYEHAERTTKTDVVDDDMELIRRSLDDADELARFFRSPVISREKKRDVVRELFSQRIDPVTLEFLEMLIRKKREDVFPEIAQAYRSLRDEQLGLVEATARTPRELSGAEQDDIAKAVGRLTGREVRLAVVTDESLIGGIVIRVGDTVYDGSVRRQLEMLRDRMEVGSISLN